MDAAAQTGLDFVHFNGMSGELYFPEMMGPGGALFDYDGDGDLDVYVCQYGPNALYRQNGKEAGYTFTEVIKDAGHSSNLDQPEAFDRVLGDFHGTLPPERA